MSERKPQSIELVTSGGFTGRGLGSIRIDGDRAIVDNRITARVTNAELDRLAALAPPSSDGRPVTPDAIVYTLRIGERSFQSSEPSAWSDTLLAIRQRIVDQTPSSMPST